MLVRIALFMVAALGFGGYYTVKNYPPAQAFFVTFYAIATGDREMLFESETPKEAAGKITDRFDIFGTAETPGTQHASTTDTATATPAAPRDFSPRKQRTRADGGYGFGVRQKKAPRAKFTD